MFIATRAAGCCRHSRCLLALRQRAKASSIHDNRFHSPQYAFHCCVANEYLSLRDRHLVPMLPMHADAYMFMCLMAKRWAHKLRFAQRAHPLEWISLRCSRVKRKYRDIWPSARLDRTPIKMFVKFEKTGAAKIAKPPRAIQAYTPTYNCLLSDYLLPIEALVMMRHSAVNGGLRLFAKGRNAKQRAADILAMAVWPDTVYVEADHSRFDSRISFEHLLVEFGFYLELNGDPEFASLLSRQLAGSGFSAGGLKYYCRGRRKSGVVNTGLGNSVVNYLILSYVLAGVPHRLYIDGDDSVITVPRGYYEEINFQRFAEAGMDTEYKPVTLQQLRFCQAAVLHLPDGPCMVREPERALSRGAYSAAANVPSDYYRMMATCEARVNNGVPMLAPYFRANMGPYKCMRFDLVGYNAARDYYCRPEETLAITEAVRFEFAEVFGVSPEEQRAFEAKCGQWLPPCECQRRVATSALTVEDALQHSRSLE
ncbi:hypothetical protein 3 [Beihai tombus-like virus 12]|uniref:hypothetical protein 3 n=1 Tax=Beihai tombus-like virus 12 TaxID=1922715 RepID=UPI00090AB354|nr:hypothetical protein 3 [Beihai tombus-like virus 12]APG76139.1 hypothetical protein 3 [Beihai tombus-like virus 12]